MNLRFVPGFAACLLAPALASRADPVRLSVPREKVSIASPRAVELADLDGDGRLDAVAVGLSPARYAAYEGNGDGTFGEELASGSLYLQPTDLVVGDFDGDGILDIAGINNACSG